MSQAGRFTSGGTPPGDIVETLTGNIGGPVGPTGNNINIVGAGDITVTGNPGTSTLTITTSGDVANEFDTDAGNAIPVAGVLNIFGGANINTSGAGNTVTVNLDTSIIQPITNSSGSQGLYSLGTDRFMHDYGTHNTFLGGQAGNLTLTTGSATDNVGIGFQALSDLTTASQNISVGSGALANMASGQGNVAIGYLALNAPTNSNANTAIGFLSMRNSTTGGSNVAIGQQSMGGGITTGQDNVAIGSLSGFNITSGFNNSFVGSISGFNNTTGANNTGIGRAALSSITTGTSNTAIGSSALSATITDAQNVAVGSLSLASLNGGGGSNTAVGHRSLFALVTGTGNVAVGNLAMSAIDGTQNTAVGILALGNATSGVSNVAIGARSQENTISGTFNVSVGHSSLTGATNSTSNTAVGWTSLSGIATGNYNTAMGANSGQNLTLADSSNIMISNLGTSGDSNTTRIGTQGAGNGQQDTCYIAGIAGVTITGPDVVTIDPATGQLGAATFPSGGASNFVTDSGTATESSGSINIFSGMASGGVADNIETSGSGSTVSVALKNSISQPATNSSGTTGMYSLAGSSFMHGYGALNTFLGQSSGNLTLNATTANSNTGVGTQSLFNLTTGSENAAFGLNASYNARSCIETCAFGNNALFTNQSSFYHCAFGLQALYHLTSGSYNNAFGINALYGVVTGTSNCSFGSYSTFSLTSGSFNTGFGDGALVNLLTGSNNIAIGPSAGIGYVGAESSNIAIGNAGTAAESHVIRIGTQGAGAGQQNACYIAGIASVAVANTQMVTIDTSTGQLGSKVIPGVIVYANVNTTPYVVLSTDYYLSVDCSGGAITIQLPNAPATNKTFIIKDRTGSSATNNITVTTVGGAVNIDGAVTYVMNSNYSSIQLLFNATTYEIF